MRTWCIARERLKEQDLRTITPQRWRKAQLMASTMLVWPLPLALVWCARLSSKPL